MAAPARTPLAAPAARVELVTSSAGFAALQREWDALVERCDDQIFYRHGFLRTWLQHFAAGAALRVLVQRDGHGRLVAALPLLAVRGSVHGVPLREWRSFGNDHSCRFDLLADDPTAAAAAFVEFLRDRTDWDLLRLVEVPREGSAMALLRAADAAGIAQGCWASQESPYALLPPGWDAFEATLRKRFRASLRRRLRRLEALGEVTVERVDGGPLLAARLAEGFALEAAGWKGRAGTAIVQHPATHGFYRALADGMAAEGQLALWFLRLDGAPIAFDFSLEHRGRLLLLKTAYDERYARCAPGQLLLHNELRDAVERGMHECDFLGTRSTAKLDWAPLLRPHAWIYLFRGSRGRLARLLKFGVAPVLKRLLERGPTADPGEAERLRD